MTPREYWERLRRSFADKYVEEVEERNGKEAGQDAEPPHRAAKKPAI